jgi:hypothetical protein
MRTVQYFLFLILFSCSPQNRAGNTEPLIVTKEPKDLPFVGFNTKASLKIKQQIVYVDSIFALLSENARRNTVLRMPGGNRSQKEVAADWTDKKMNMWIDLQKKYGFRMVYCVNGNDSPQNQLNLIRRWEANGARFDFLELMSEYYLPKFSEPKLEKEEVTRQVDVESYTQEIIPAYLPYLDSLNYPYYVIFAPVKYDWKGRERYAKWNDVMVDFVNQSNRKYGAVLHLYTKDVDEPYDYDQIVRLRERLPEGTPFAITEMGVLDWEIPEERHIQETLKHWEQIVDRLDGSDYVMDQVLYHNYREENMMANSHPRNGGITPKGRALVELFNQYYP